MPSLHAKKCVPCRGGVPPLSQEIRHELLRELMNWQIVADHHISKTYIFDDFASALQWVNHIGALAEKEGHHPDILLSWGKVQVDIWTHKIDNLTESDFILAAKIDELKKANP